MITLVKTPPPTLFFRSEDDHSCSADARDATPHAHHTPRQDNHAVIVVITGYEPTHQTTVVTHVALKDAG